MGGKGVACMRAYNGVNRWRVYSGVDRWGPGFLGRWVLGRWALGPNIVFINSGVQR